MLSSNTPFTRIVVDLVLTRVPTTKRVHVFEVLCKLIQLLALLSIALLLDGFDFLHSNIYP